jgi:hypothetical protein
MNKPSLNGTFRETTGKEAAVEDEETKLDRLLRESVGLEENQPITDFCLPLRESMRLDLYPDEYVAFVDSWAGEGNPTHLASRKIFFHDPSLVKINQLIQTLPEEIRRTVAIDWSGD